MTIWPCLPVSGVLSVYDADSLWHEVYCLPAGIDWEWMT
jgi:hypothetical protein